MAILDSGSIERKMFARLGISSLAEILDRDYRDLSCEHDVDRGAHARLYSNQGRGSVRLASGLFYTIKEHEERVERIKNQQLP